MREIKFRVYDRLGKRMSDSFALFGETTCFGLIEQWLGEIPSDKTSLERFGDIEEMQFTGLKDKNGKEIYESDIVKCGYGTGKVVEMLGCFMVQWIDDKAAEMEFLGFNKKVRRQREDNEQFEIIGNIYETPQLIQQ